MMKKKTYKASRRKTKQKPANERQNLTNLAQKS